MRIDRLSIALLLGAALCAAPAFAQTAATAEAGASAKTSNHSKAAATETAGSVPTPAQTPSAAAAKKGVHKGGPTRNATAADIANAKAKGMVWVNTSTGVYHKDGQYFGATKQGKFMTEPDAQKAGYRRKDPAVAAETAKAAKAKAGTK